MRQRVQDIATQLKETGSFQEPARAKLLETRKAITHDWLNVADAIDVQGETSLAGEVRHFARHLPRVLTDKERIAVALVEHIANSQQTPLREHTSEKTRDLTR